MWFNTLQHHPWPALQWGVVIGASLVGAVLDARSQRIPNALTGPLLASGLAVSTWAGAVPGLFDSLAGCAALAVPYVLLYALAGGGAGDAKLMGALGAWLGLVQGVIVLVAVALCGGLLAIVYALAKRRLGRTFGLVAHAARAFSGFCVGALSLRDAGAAFPADSEVQPMPYGPAILLGVLLSAGGLLLWPI
jgi:prepilin peptidase CpaA